MVAPVILVLQMLAPHALRHKHTARGCRLAPPVLVVPILNAPRLAWRSHDPSLSEREWRASAYVLGLVVRMSRIMFSQNAFRVRAFAVGT